MAPQQWAFAFFCLPIFRRRLTIWPVAAPGAVCGGWVVVMDNKAMPNFVQ